MSIFSVLILALLISCNKPSVQKPLDCDEEICLQLRNHNKSNKSVDIFMKNKVPVAGFQCDLKGITINSSDGGLLKQFEYQSSNSENRLLSFSMQGTTIPIGEGILTNITYLEIADSICMDKIIFASKSGKQLTTNQPECFR